MQCVMLSREAKAMGFERPIVIMGASRSGTSLTAGIFAAHGVWTGKCMAADKRNPKGFFENKAMKQYFRSGRLDPQSWKSFIKETLDLEGYQGGAYLFKHGAERWPLWSEFKPYLICCRRPYDTFAKSRDRAGFKPISRNVWQRYQDIMDKAIEVNGGVNIYADHFKKGDFSSIEEALSYAGIEPDINKIRSFYEPRLWNFSAG